MQGKYKTKKLDTRTKLLPSEEAKFQSWRKGLPKNLQADNELYDLRGAYKGGIQPEKVEDGTYHMGTRVPSTGQILKSPLHPTYKMGIEEDAKLGYLPHAGTDGKMYTKNIMKEPQFKKGTKKVKIKKYNDGTDSVNPNSATATSASLNSLGMVGTIGSGLLEGATASKYDPKYTSQLKDENQALGRGIGAGAGQALNLVVPGLGSIASPLLSSAGGAVQRGFQNDKLEKLKKTDEFNQRVTKVNDNIKTDLTSFQAKQYSKGSKKVVAKEQPLTQKIGNKTAEYTVAGMRKVLPINAAMYAQDLGGNIIRDITGDKLIDKKKIPLTEKDLNSSEIKELQYAAKNRVSNNAITYDDFNTNKKYGKSIIDTIKDPALRLQTTLGNASLKEEKKSYNIKDTFDFNDVEEDNNKSIYNSNRPWNLVSPYKKIRDIASMYGSADGKGIPVNLNIPKSSKTPSKAISVSGTYEKGTKVIEIEGKKTPEIHTDENFNLKNLGTTPHSKGGDKVVAEEGDVVFPTQNSEKKYNEIMNAIMKKDKYKLKKEQNKLPEDKASKYSTGVKKTVIDTTEVPELVSNKGLGKTSVKYKGKTYKGLGNKVDQKKNYKPEYVKEAWAAKNRGEVEILNDGAYPTPYFRHNGGAAIAVNQREEEVTSDEPTLSKGDAEGRDAEESYKFPTKSNTLAPVTPAKSIERTSKYNPLELASTAYNLGQGLFGKAEKVNRKDYNPQLEQYVDTSNNMRREVNQAYKGALSDARNLSGGLASNVRANSQAAANAKLGQVNQIDSQEYGKQLDVNNRNVDRTNDGKKINIDLFNNYEDLDARNRAVKSDALSRGLEGLSDIGARSNQNRNALQAHLIDSDTIRAGYSYGNNTTTSGTQVTSQDVGFNGNGSGIPMSTNPLANFGLNKKVKKGEKGIKSLNVTRKYKVKK